MLLLLVLLITAVCPSAAIWTDFEIVSIANMNLTGPVTFDFKLTRLTRHKFGVSGTLIVGDFLHYLSEGRIYYSAKADGRWSLTPYHAPAKPMCTQVNNFYVKFVMKSLANCSDLPQTEQAGPAVCDAFANKTFTIHNYVLDPAVVPRLFQRGLYRVEIRVLSDDLQVAGMEVVARLS